MTDITPIMIGSPETGLDPRLGPSGVIPAGAVAITDGTVSEAGSKAGAFHKRCI